MTSIPPSLPDALDGERLSLATSDGEVAYYRAGPDHPHAADALVPLLLLHSINAAASAYEVKPLFDHYRETRAVYAIDFPGYGFSDRTDRVYTARLMTDAIHALVERIAMRHGGLPVDAIAVSLGCEFLARAASERADAFRTIALVSATGLNRLRPRDGPPGSSRGQAFLLKAFGKAPWSPAFYRFLTRRGVIRYFLAKTWGSKHIDEGLLDYDVVTTKQPGARYAPFYFVSAFLFSADITTVYRAIGAPVWLVHGTRGDFTDYRAAPRLVAERGWTEHVMETGALPYFERLDDFVDAYDAWVHAVVPAR